jgi:hypothetical protein
LLKLGEIDDNTSPIQTMEQPGTAEIQRTKHLDTLAYRYITVGMFDATVMTNLTGT